MATRLCSDRRRGWLKKHFFREMAAFMGVLPEGSIIAILRFAQMASLLKKKERLDLTRKSGPKAESSLSSSKFALKKIGFAQVSNTGSRVPPAVTSPGLRLWMALTDS